MTDTSQEESKANGAATVKGAADRLQHALKSLENSLDPMLKRMGELQSSAQDDEANTAKNQALEDEVKRAREREEQYKEREQEFSSLAQETTRELDAVISQVLHALGDDN